MLLLVKLLLEAAVDFGVEVAGLCTRSLKAQRLQRKRFLGTDLGTD